MTIPSVGMTIFINNLITEWTIGKIVFLLKLFVISRVSISNFIRVPVKLNEVRVESLIKH